MKSKKTLLILVVDSTTRKKGKKMVEQGLWGKEEGRLRADGVGRGIKKKKGGKKRGKKKDRYRKMEKWRLGNKRWG